MCAFVCVCWGTFSTSVPVPFWCRLIFSRVLSGAFGWVQMLVFLPMLSYLCAMHARLPCHSPSVGVTLFFWQKSVDVPPRRSCRDTHSLRRLRAETSIPFTWQDFLNPPPHEQCSWRIEGVCLSHFHSLSIFLCVVTKRDRGTKKERRHRSYLRPQGGN